MNQLENNSASHAPLAAAGQDDAEQLLSRIGSSLESARQNNELEVQVVADELNIFSRHISAMEAGKLPDVAPAYARGYLKLYAGYLSLNVTKILADYDRALAPVEEIIEPESDLTTKAQSLSVWQPFFHSLQCFADTLRRLVHRYLRAGWSVSLPASILAVVCVAYYSIDATRLEDETLVLANLEAQQVSKLGVLASEAVSVNAGESPAEEVTAQLATGSSQDGGLSAPLLAFSTNESENAGVPVQRGVAGVITVGELAASSQRRSMVPGNELEDSFEPVGPGAVEMITQVQQSDRLVITVYEDSWIDVRDNVGARLYRDLARAGRRIDVSGELPFALHVGNAPGLEIRLNGEPVEINRYRSDNSARLTLASN